MFAEEEDAIASVSTGGDMGGRGMTTTMGGVPLDAADYIRGEEGKEEIDAIIQEEKLKKDELAKQKPSDTKPPDSKKEAIKPRGPPPPATPPNNRPIEEELEEERKKRSTGIIACAFVLLVVVLAIVLGVVIPKNGADDPDKSDPTEAPAKPPDTDPPVTPLPPPTLVPSPSPTFSPVEFTPLSEDPDAEVLTEVSNCENCEESVEVMLEVPVGDSVVNMLTVSSNGFVDLVCQDVGNCASIDVLSTTELNPSIQGEVIVLGRMDGGDTESGTSRILQEGTSPPADFDSYIISYENVTLTGREGSFINAQAVLYSGTGIVDVCWGEGNVQGGEFRAGIWNVENEIYVPAVGPNFDPNGFSDQFPANTCQRFDLNPQVVTDPPTTLPSSAPEVPDTPSPVPDTFPPVGPAPTTPSPITDAPVTAAPVTDAPVVLPPPTPLPLTPAPTTSMPPFGVPTQAPISNCESSQGLCVEDYEAFTAALGAAQAGDTIAVCGTIVVPEPITVSASDLTICCSDSSRCSLSAGGNNQIMTVLGESLVLRGLTLDGGVDETGEGGGNIAFRATGHHQIVQCQISNGGSAGSGGNVFVSGASSFTIENSIIESGTSQGQGGGIMFEETPSITIQGSFFTANEASTDGGGLAITFGSLNQEPFQGNVTIEDTYFQSNMAIVGGGIILLDSQPSTSLFVLDCFFLINDATRAGGAVAVLEEAMVSFFGNDGEGNGGSSDQCPDYFLPWSAFQCIAVDVDFMFPDDGDTPPPSGAPTTVPTVPTLPPATLSPTIDPTDAPVSIPTSSPTLVPTDAPESTPTTTPTAAITTSDPTQSPAQVVTDAPSALTDAPSALTDAPSLGPMPIPGPTPAPILEPTPGPIPEPATTTPTLEATDFPTLIPLVPTDAPTPGTTQATGCEPTFGQCAGDSEEFVAQLAEVTEGGVIGFCGSFEVSSPIPELTTSQVTLCCAGGDVCNLGGSGQKLVVRGSDVNITGISFSGGVVSGENGGNVVIDAPGHHHISDCTFSSGISNQYGGNLFVANADSITIVGSTFGLGSGSWGGGGVAIDDTPMVLIEDTVFTNNNGRGGGGVLILYTAPITGPVNPDNIPQETDIIACTFESNNAVVGGGFMISGFGTQSIIQVSDSDFVNNRAGDTGGAGAFIQPTLIFSNGNTGEGNVADNEDEDSCDGFIAVTGADTACLAVDETVPSPEKR